MRWRTRAGDEVSRDPRRAADQGPDRARPGARRWTRRATGSRRCWRPPTGGSPRCAAACPDAGGLVIATDHQSARAYAAQLRRITGEAPTVVLSDEAGRQRADRGLRRGRRPLDGRRPDGVRGRRRPAARRSASTPPRRRRRCSSRRRSAASCGPGGGARRRRSSCRRCRCCCSTPPRWRSSATTPSTGRPPTTRTTFRRRGRAAGRGQPGCRRRPAPTSSPFEALEAEATFDRVLFDGGEFGTEAAVGSEEEADFLGLPGLLEPRPGHHPAAAPGRAAHQVGPAAGARRRGAAGEAAAAPGGAGAAQGAQRPGRRLAPPHRHPARRGAHGAAAGLRRPARGRRRAPSSCRPGST